MFGCSLLRCVALSLLLVALPAFAATTAQEVEEDHATTSELVTPHKPWGKGLAGGPVRALCFVNMGPYDGSWSDLGTRLREVVELRQRFDIEVDAVLVGGAGNLATWNFQGNEFGQRRAERLLAKPYPLYILAGVPMEKLPAKLQYLMIAEVAKGAGLVCCGPIAKEAMTAKRRLTPTPDTLVQGLPALDGRPVQDYTAAYKLGKGRGVHLNYQANSLTPFKEFSYRALAEYDYRQLIVGRAALWAAGRTGTVAVSGVLAARPLVLGQATQPEDGIRVAATGAAPVAAKVAVELRRVHDGQVTKLGETAVQAASDAGTKVPVVLPKDLRAGDYFVDAVVRSSRGVEACGAGNLTITSAAGIDKVALDERYVERGRTIHGKVTLRGTPPAGAVLRLRFRDSWDRVLLQRDLPATATSEFDYRADEFATILMRVEAVLLAGGQEIELKDASFTVPKRRRGQHNFVMWDTPQDVLGYWAQRQMQLAGYNVCLLGSFGERPTPAVLKACDISLVPYSTRILDDKNPQGHMLPVCWNHEPDVTNHVQKIVNNQRQLRETGVFTYSLGDEGVTLGCCVHPDCIAAYRRWLQKQYGDIAKLNASWGSTYGSFGEVDLLDHKDNLENGALPKSPARWYDRQAFARYNLMQFAGRFREDYLRIDPEAICGFEGTGGFGDDYDGLCNVNTFYGPYPSIGDDLVRSVAPRSLIRSNWFGYSKTADALSDAPWRMVMKGMDSAWYWMWSGVGSWRGYLTPTLSFWPATAEVTREMEPVRHGLGDLVISNPVAHSGIAVYYSVASALADKIEPGLDFLTPEVTHNTFTQLTYDLGLDFRYLTSDMLARGALSRQEFSILVLPKCQALTPSDATAIRQFVEAGGTVVADVRPGVFDGHCKPVPAGMLDDLFGIKHKPAVKATRTALSDKIATQGAKLDLQVKEAHVDGGVEAAGATALSKAGQTPLFLVNKVGAGQALLLNWQAPAPKPDDPDTVALRKVWRFVYDLAQVRSPVKATAPDGGPLPLVETRVWRNGQGLMFGLWRQMQCAWFSPASGTVAGEPVAARVTLPAPMHVYDLRGGRYLGQVRTLDTSLRWGRASFFLALPYAIQGLDVNLSSAQPPAGSTLTAGLKLRVPAGAGEQHAVWVTVTDPAGQQPLWGRQTLLLKNGAGEVRVPVAHNDQPGRWRLTATELFSGRSAEVTWTVR